jgi:hypothetical protein
MGLARRGPVNAGFELELVGAERYRGQTEHVISGFTFLVPDAARSQYAQPRIDINWRLVGQSLSMRAVSIWRSISRVDPINSFR